MSSASGNVPKPEPQDLTPEEAERCAASIRPSWEFSEAPFVATAQVPAPMPEQAQGGAIGGRTVMGGMQAGDLEAAIKAHQSAPAMPVAQNAPLQSARPRPPNVVIPSASALAHVARSMQTEPPAARLRQEERERAHEQERKRRAVSSANHRVAARDDFEVPLRRSNKPIILGILGVVVLIGAGLGIRAALAPSDTDVKPSTALSAPTTLGRDEARAIPPPPPQSDLPAKTAATAQPAMTISPPPTPVAAKTQETRPTPPQPRAAVAPRAPTPPAPPKTPPKAPAGGIVRDNPF